MIWHDETFITESETIQIIGEFNNNTVTIILKCRGLQSTLFNKTISQGMRREEPTEEDIENKFGWKIEKFKSNVTSATLGRRFGLIEGLTDEAGDGRPDVRD